MALPSAPTGGRTQTTTVSLWMSMPHERRYTGFILHLLPPGEERSERNWSFLTGLPTLRQEPHCSVPLTRSGPHSQTAFALPDRTQPRSPAAYSDRKSTRLNSSHLVISYAVFCLKK